MVFRCSLHSPSISKCLSLSPFPKPGSPTVLTPLLSRKVMAVHTTLLPKGNPVSGAGGGTVAEPLVVPQCPFSPSIITELKLSPGCLEQRLHFPDGHAAEFINDGAHSPSTPLTSEALPRQLLLSHILHLSGISRGTDIAYHHLYSHPPFFSKGLCSGRPCAALKCSVSKVLVGSHMTLFWPMRFSGRWLEGPEKVFAEATTLCFWMPSGSAVAVRFCDHSATLKRKG